VRLFLYETMTLHWFVGVMLAKLGENAWKSPWSKSSVKWLRNRLRQEVAELGRAIRNGDTAEAVAREAADVANFAMMIADNYRREAERCRVEMN